MKDQRSKALEAVGVELIIVRKNRTRFLGFYARV